MASRRVERVQEQVQQELAKLLLRDVKDPRLNAVTITEVEMTGDLRTARIYYVSYDDVRPESLGSAFERASGFLRRQLGQRLRLRHVPELDFRYDHSGQRGRRMEALLESLREDGQMGEPEEAASDDGTEGPPPVEPQENET